MHKHNQILELQIIVIKTIQAINHIINKKQEVLDLEEENSMDISQVSNKINREMIINILKVCKIKDNKKLLKDKKLSLKKKN